MFFYEYYCAKNGRTVEVSHAFGVRLKTWGELCAHAGIDLGTTPAQSPVSRLIGGMPFLPRLKGLDKDEPGKKLIV